MVVKIAITGALAAFGLLLASVLSPAAWGTFPGRDGRIALTVDAGQHQTIATMEPDGSDVRYLPSAGVHAWGPGWSPDGKRIVFVRAGPGYPDIYLMNANGSGVRRLTSDPKWWDVDPSFSPGGKRIIFYRLFQGPNPRPGQIIIMRLRDLRMRVLTTDGIHPAWSPNGRRIAFTDETLEGREDIATMRTDGTHKHRLTDAASTPYSYYGPAYTADGHTIYFEREPMARGYRPALMKISASGGPAYPVRLPTKVGLLQGPVPDPEGGCVVGTSDRSPSQTPLYAFGQTCPTQGWINSPGGASSWQALPDR